MSSEARKLAVFVILAAICVPSIAENCDAKHSTCDPRGELAMEYVHSLFGNPDSALDVWIAGDYGVSGRVRIEEREHRLEKLAKWAEGLNAEDRRAYLGIIDSYEDGEKEAYAEWHTHDLQRKQEAYKKHLRECAEAARKSASRNALPKPPETIFEEKTHAK